MKILVTGAAGFIGYHLVKRLLLMGHSVLGLDNINAYYNVQLKLDRLMETGVSSSELWYNRVLQSKMHPQYRFIQLSLDDRHNMQHLFRDESFDIVVNFAAQAGVRYSIDNPQTYIESNIVGFHNILECCRQFPVRHLVYASSSSVYGNNTKIPFSETDNVDHPISLYAATKKSNELMAYTYSHLYGIKTTGLRFFTVYGPWGRPDMAYFRFTEAILQDKPIQVFNHGQLKRDFTYIDDIINGVSRVVADQTTEVNDNYRIFNIGNHQPYSLMEFISTLEKLLEKQAVKNYLPMQPGDVVTTYADIDNIKSAYGFEPETTLEEGLTNFVHWYRAYHKA